MTIEEKLSDHIHNIWLAIQDIRKIRGEELHKRFTTEKEETISDWKLDKMELLEKLLCECSDELGELKSVYKS